MNIRDYLKDQILLFDGAMGTYFSSIHSDPHYPCEDANITIPGTISKIHRRYLEAGAMAIKTNTFSLARPEQHPIFSMEEVVTTAFSLAKEQADPFGAYVFADINISIAKGDKAQFEWYRSIVDTFLSVGATHFLFETCQSGEHLNELAEHIKEQCPDAFIMASFAVGPDGFTQSGHWAQRLFSGLSPHIEGGGFNCVSGPRPMSELAKRVEWNGFLSAMPNASYPVVAGSRLRFGENPSYFAEEMLEVAQSGCRILGGCCGTTPEFISQLKAKLSPIIPTKKATVSPVPSTEPIVRNSDFYEKLKSGKKPIAVEWDSPVTPDIQGYMANAKLLQQAGVDLITIADCPVARARMDSSLVACKLRRELGIHAMPHMTCRDRNINASKSLLLGLAVEDINDILIITGDPIPKEQRNEIKGVYEFNSRMLIHHISQLNQSLFPSPFYLYGALNVNAVNFESQLRHAREKEEKGAVALFTQPVLSKRGLENLKIAKETLNIPLVGGVFPPTSYRNINFLANEIPGFHVDPELIELYQDKSVDQCSDLAVELSCRTLADISPYVDGYYIVTPFQRVDLILRILEEYSF
ncbi:MAG: bifunctional homocysteine S-methyltransferase/methylenetetrahydrofolate reductase [Eubacteriales bacterium]